MREFLQLWRWRCLHCCGRQSWPGHISSYLYGNCGSGLLEGRAALRATAHVMCCKSTVVGYTSSCTQQNACMFCSMCKQKGELGFWFSLLAACAGAHISALYLWQITILRASTFQRPATWLGLYVISEDSPLCELIPQVCKAARHAWGTFTMPGRICSWQPLKASICTHVVLSSGILLHDPGGPACSFAHFVCSTRFL